MLREKEVATVVHVRDDHFQLRNSAGLVSGWLRRDHFVYDEGYDLEDCDVSTFTGKSEPTDAVERALRLPGIGAALDLGAGSGWSTKVLHDLGYSSIDAVDKTTFAWNACGFAKNLPGVIFHKAGEEEFLSCAGTYDAINVTFPLSAERASSLAAKHLREGGRMMVPADDASRMRTFGKVDGVIKILAEESRWGAIPGTPLLGPSSPISHIGFGSPMGPGSPVASHSPVGLRSPVFCPNPPSPIVSSHSPVGPRSPIGPNTPTAPRSPPTIITASTRPRSRQR